VPVKKHSVEQIIAKLREVEKLTGQGMSIPMAAKRVRVTDQTFYRWRTRYGALKEEEAKRLQLLEQENAAAQADRRRSGPRHLHAEGPAAGKIPRNSCRDGRGPAALASAGSRAIGGRGVIRGKRRGNEPRPERVGRSPVPDFLVRLTTLIFLSRESRVR
jgi:hypothetical protein